MALRSEKMGCFQIASDPLATRETRENLWVALEFYCTYLFADCTRHRHWEWPHIAAAQVLPFALVTEELEFSLLLIIQAVAVAYLQTHTRTATYEVTSVTIVYRSVCDQSLIKALYALCHKWESVI